MKNKRWCFACDLKDDPALIEQYKQFHAPGGVWPDILESIRNAGVLDMEIYLTGNRLFMIMETTPDFDPAAKSAADVANPRVQEWEQLMWKFQQAVPWAKQGEKWTPMELIFNML